MLELQTSTCPDENQLLLSLQGMLSPQARASIEQHIDRCDACRLLVAQLIRDSAQPELDGHETPAPSEVLRRGTNLGRYVLLDCIGSGGTAVVYAAYDPELERKVAIKLLRTDLPGFGSPEANRDQLLLEAQAMARLSHPNVIVVFDVGTFGDRVFLAMEFIRGKSLRSWLEEQPRSWGEILEVFLKAGEGLRAAHHSGLVHRDFKPDNVLIADDDGRVRVTDFGLAHALRPAGAEGVLASSKGPRRGSLGKRALVGTPAYIAPEQWKSQPADERTDQFSFCVALYEALYGKRPYPGRTSATLSDAVQEPRSDRSIPSWMRRALLRGLRVKPEDRYRSMQELLRALTDGLSVRRVRRGLAGSVLALIALVCLGYWGLSASAARKLELDLARAAELFRDKATERQRMIDLRAEATLKKEYLLDALGKADDVDATLGLAPQSHDEELAFANEVITSADLPFLKSEDVLLLVDASGRVVYNAGDESRWGEKVSGIHALELALSGQGVEELWSPKQVRGFPVPLSANLPANDLLLVFARPITRGRNPLGAALWGQWIGSSFLPELEQMVGDRLVLRSHDGEGVATLAGAAEAERRRSSRSRHRVWIGTARYLAQPVEMAGLSGHPMGEATLLRNLDQELEPVLSRFRRGAIVLLSAAAALSLAAYAIWRMRRRRLVSS